MPRAQIGPAVLHSLEITAEVAGTAQGNVTHNLHWKQRIEIDLDCFLCARTGRTTVFEWGSSAAICTAHADAAHHPTSARIEHLHCDAQAERRMLRAVVDCWWSPFHDEVADAAAEPLSEQTPVRLALGYFCRRNHRSGVGTVHVGMPTPTDVRCEYCDVTMATLDTSPTMRLLS
jgi:hypothetical protein